MQQIDPEIDDKILRHIFCDYQYGVLPNCIILNEEHGLVPEIYTYVMCFESFVNHKIIPFIRDGGTYAETITNAGIFYPIKHRFFDSCKISIIAGINSDNPKWKSRYVDDESFYGENGSRVVIELNASASDENKLLSLLSSNFAHELTHAYDDYKSRIGGNSSIGKAVIDSNYQERGLTWSLGKEDNVKMLGKALYLLSPMERNALIGQISTEMSGKKTRNPQDALNSLKETNSYKQYLFLKKFVESTNNTTDDLAKNELLNAYVNWISYNKNRNKFPDKKYNPRKNLTYEGFLSELNAMFRKWERKYLTVAGKIAYNHYIHNEMGEINMGSEDEFEPKASLPRPSVNEDIFPGEMEYYYDEKWQVNEF